MLPAHLNRNIIHITHTLTRKNTTTAPAPNKKIGAASEDSSGPSLRLLRGVKAAGGAEGARRLETLARRLPMERAALEAAAAAGVAEAREWRAMVGEQAAAVLSLGQVGGGPGGGACVRACVCNYSVMIAALVNA